MELGLTAADAEPSFTPPFTYSAHPRCLNNTTMETTPSPAQGLSRSASMMVKRRNSRRPSITALNKFEAATLPDTSPFQVARAVSPSQVRMDSRVRSDSALASLRRRQTTPESDGVNDQEPREPSSSPRRRQRFSLGVTTLGPTYGLHHKRPDGFFDVFGFLGIPMLLIFGSTSLAVLCQAYIQVFPIQFANYLMDTGSLDDGEFWMLPESEIVPTVIATLLLIGFAACYIYLAAFMVFFRSRAIVKRKTRPHAPTSPSSPSRNESSSRTGSVGRFGSRSGSMRLRSKAKLFPELSSTQLLRLMLPMIWRPDSAGKDVVQVPTLPDPPPSRKDSFRNDVVPVGAAPTDAKLKKNPKDAMTNIPVAEIYKQFVRPDGVYNSYYNVLYDTPKLVLQSITLLAYLRKGFPIALTAFYASLLTFNYLISFYRFQRKRIDHALHVTRLFYLFDLFFAAFAPIVVLAFAYYNFHFDRDVYATKTETMAPGVFDRIARSYADPHEMSVFHLSFGSLRLTTASTLFTKCSLLFLSVYKWKKIIVYLIQRNHSKQRQMKGHVPKLRKHSSSRRHLIFGMVMFIFFGSGIVLYTAGSISTSLHHCSAYREHCVVISYHWTFPGEGCPCLVYINRKLDPRTFDEWTNPPDATEELQAVAQMGELKVIQIINRALPTFPDNLRKCTKLEQMILMYSKTESIPEWAQEFEHLQYFHIEGDFQKNLKTLPMDVFTKMHELQYLHTGVIPQLTEYPKLSGLEKLKTLAIACAHSLTTLPSLDALENLRVLLLVELYHVPRLPSLQKLRNLHSVSVFYRNEMCCNGFITPGQCNLTEYQCYPRQNERTVQCVQDSIPADDAAILKEVGATMCPDFRFDLKDFAPTKATTDDLCGGVLFRKCYLPGSPPVQGMCYNGRMQVVYCDATGDYERMRRLQILRGVGTPCDPTEEAWLGCR